MTLADIGTIVNAGGVVFLLIAALWGGYKGMWVYGRTYDAKATETEAWKAMALRGINAAEKGATVAEALTTAANGK